MRPSLRRGACSAECTALPLPPLLCSYPWPGSPAPSATQYAMVGEFGGIGSWTTGQNEWANGACEPPPRPSSRASTLPADSNTLPHPAGQCGTYLHEDTYQDYADTCAQPPCTDCRRSCRTRSPHPTPAQTRRWRRSFWGSSRAPACLCPSTRRRPTSRTSATAWSTVRRRKRAGDNEAHASGLSLYLCPLSRSEPRRQIQCHPAGGDQGGKPRTHGTVLEGCW